jgi:hypothetical protein
MSRRHDQKPEKKHMTCSNCHAGNCEQCVDVIHILLGQPCICQCTRRGHSGEPRDKQIADPETGAVYAPGLTVQQDGTVEFHGR